MKAIAAIVVLALISVISAQNVTVAVARTQGTTFDPTISGYVTFTPTDGGNITMTVNITGITQYVGNNHGVHLHQFGDLTLNNGVSVGSHWDSNGQPHGCPENNGTARHIGDTGNWFVDMDGNMIGTKNLDLIGLNGGVNSVVGFAVIIHNFTDNCATVASSAARLAQGVIGIANPNYHGGNQNLATPSTSYTGANGATTAVCVLQPASNQLSGASPVTGTVYFTQTTNGVQVSAVIYGLVQDNKPRGFHVHQWGDLSLADATSAGTHFTGPYYNTTAVHGIPILGQDRPHHVGDMGNLFVYAENGTAYYYNVLSSLGLYGSVNNIIGRAVVLHNNTDDCTGANGNSGARIAYCVIGSANPAYGGAVAPMTGINSTQSIANCPVVPLATTGMDATTSAGSIVFACLMLIIAALFA